MPIINSLSISNLLVLYLLDNVLRKHDLIDKSDNILKLDETVLFTNLSRKNIIRGKKENESQEQKQDAGENI